MISPSHCTAEFKCWEQSQGWCARVTERDIVLAITLARFRAATLINTTESAQNLRTAADLLRSLQNRQWREMVRQPFTFTSPLKQALENPSKTLTLDDLDLDL